MKTESAGFTTTGRREQNEDYYCADESLGLFAVSDGMGGYRGGEVASRIAIGSLVSFFQDLDDNPEQTVVYGYDTSRSFDEGMVEMAVQMANRQVCVRKVGHLASMGTTIAILAVRDDEGVIAHVGDSRVYRLRDGKLRQMTRDHSLYNELQAAGAPNLPPINQFPYRNVVTRALGSPGRTKIDVQTVDLRQGDIFMLCSDGVTEVLSEDTIDRILRNIPVELAGEAIVTAAYNAGSRDNITSVVVKIDDANESALISTDTLPSMAA